MPATVAPLLDCTRISDAILGRIAELDPELDGLARRHLARLTPERWTIEWHLPWWLGHRFGLDKRLAEALVRANVLGMLSVRLEDDLEDGDVPAQEMPRVRLLAQVAFEEAVSEYRAWFAEDSRVWSYLDRSMADWRAGAAERDLATRGAPMKIAGYACCLIADRLGVWPELERTLDHALTALVRYDQFVDWEADLAAGRWNAFVATIADGDGDSATPERTRAAVLTAMLTSDVVSEHFNAIRQEVDAAAKLAFGIGVTELSAFLTTWAAQVSEQGTSVDAHYQAAADQATRLFFGTRMGGAAA
jgi:hypothetical protein